MIYKGLSSFKVLSTSEILLFLLNPLSSSDEITDLIGSRIEIDVEGVMCSSVSTFERDKI